MDGCQLSVNGNTFNFTASFDFTFNNLHIVHPNSSECAGPGPTPPGALFHDAARGLFNDGRRRRSGSPSPLDGRRPLPAILLLMIAHLTILLLFSFCT
jgi:hypothetical protein